MRLLIYFFLAASVSYGLCAAAGASGDSSLKGALGESSAEAATSFDYDYIPANERKSFSRWRKQTSKGYATTTERPFVRYWNSLLRNVRLPVPSLRWNMTNPFVNLFNNGEANIIETPVGDFDRKHPEPEDADDDERLRPGQVTKKKRKNRRRKNSRNTLPKYGGQKKTRHSYDYAQYDDYDKGEMVVPLYYYQGGFPQQLQQLQSSSQYVPYYYDDLPATIPTCNEDDGDDASAVASEEDDPSKLDDGEEEPQVDEDEPVDEEIDESVRNAFSTFMKDDTFNTKRQRATGLKAAKTRKSDKVTGKQKKKFEFFLFRPW